MLGQLERPSDSDVAAGDAVAELARLGGATLALAAADLDGGLGCPVLDFADSGAMWITGDHGPVSVDFPLLGHLRALSAGIAALSEAVGSRVELDPRLVVAQRAAERSLSRHGQQSANGSCRLIRCTDGWAAFNLPRPSDIELLTTVVLGARPTDDPWVALTREGTRSTAAELVDRAQLVGVPAAVLDTTPSPHRRSPVQFTAVGRRGPVDRPRIIDFSAMWAGPLCAHVLGRAGADVVQVEDPQRPDAARLGDPAMYRRLHEGHGLSQVSFSTAEGRRALAQLVDAADVVVESSRPRALAQLDLSPDQFLAGKEGRVWISITGYSRTGPGSNSVAFGDDAAVAGGAVAWAGPDRPVFCADALADPVSGLFAAFGGLVALSAGGGVLVDVSMSDASAAVRFGPTCAAVHSVDQGPDGRWKARHDGVVRAVLTPQELLTRDHG